MKSFKQRLQDHGNLIISLEQGEIKLHVPSQPENPETEPPETSDNDSKLHSASDLPDVAVKDNEEKSGIEIIMDLSTTPETKDGTKDRILEATLQSSADERAEEAAPMSEIKPKEPLFDEMTGEILKVMTVSVSKHKLKKEIKMVKEENAVSFGYYCFTRGCLCFHTKFSTSVNTGPGRVQ